MFFLGAWVDTAPEWEWLERVYMDIGVDVFSFITAATVSCPSSSLVTIQSSYPRPRVLSRSIMYFQNSPHSRKTTSTQCNNQQYRTITRFDTQDMDF